MTVAQGLVDRRSILARRADHRPRAHVGQAAFPAVVELDPFDD